LGEGIYPKGDKRGKACDQGKLSPGRKKGCEAGDHRASIIKEKGDGGGKAKSGKKHPGKGLGVQKLGVSFGTWGGGHCSRSLPDHNKEGEELEGANYEVGHSKKEKMEKMGVFWVWDKKGHFLNKGHNGHFTAMKKEGREGQKNRSRNIGSCALKIGLGS